MIKRAGETGPFLREMAMNRRLEMLYQLIPKKGCGMIDVGTDHAQIPIRLAENAYRGKIFASDIAEAPIRTARIAACEHGVENQIRFLHCDGLALCPSDEVDTILIAGMGGDTICGILDRTEWIFSGDFLLVLQPMTHADVLRYWLVHNEFAISREVVIADAGHVYQMFCARPGKAGRYRDSEYLAGKRDSVSLGDGRRLLLQWERDRLQKKTMGMIIAGQQDSPAFQFYRNILLEMEEDLKNADR